MVILLTGVSCVGKTSVGGALAELLGVPFVDLDNEVERQLGAPIERLQQRCGSMDVFRSQAAKVLMTILGSLNGQSCVIALPPSGMLGAYWRVVKQHPSVTVVLEDVPESILERINFFDADSHPIQKKFTPRERTLYLREIRKDIDYFARSYRKADLHVDISTCAIDEAAARVRDALPNPAHLDKVTKGSPNTSVQVAPLPRRT
jgi:shikimate kinase